jgi:hypothetical protein
MISFKTSTYTAKPPIAKLLLKFKTISPRGVFVRLLGEMEIEPEGFYAYSLDPRVYVKTLDYGRSGLR